MFSLVVEVSTLTGVLRLINHHFTQSLQIAPDKYFLLADSGISHASWGNTARSISHGPVIAFRLVNGVIQLIRTCREWCPPHSPEAEPECLDVLFRLLDAFKGSGGACTSRVSKQPATLTCIRKGCIVVSCMSYFLIIEISTSYTRTISKSPQCQKDLPITNQHHR